MKQLKKTILTLVALIAVTAGAWADGVVCTASDLGKVLCTDGSIYENVSAATTAGKTAVAMIAYVDETNKNGLAIALSDEGEMDWSTAKSTCEGKTAVSGAAWLLPSVEQWRAMFKAFGGNDRSYNGLNAAITAAGGTAFQGLVYYWSSTDLGGDYAYSVYLVGGSGGAEWYEDRKSGSSRVRACLAFDIADAPASSGPEVAWDNDKKTGQFTMPGGNVELEPEYYPQAVLTAKPTAINDVPATTDGAIVNAGTVANIGETTNAQGTVMYYAVQSATAPTAPDYDATGWTDKVPTATDFAEGNVYVWYYVKGADGDETSTFNDGAITKLGESGYITLLAAPTYAVTFAEGVNPEPPADPEWTASPATDVTKGQTVTVTYTGSKKVIGVKAEKKAATPSLNITNPVVGQVIGSDGKNYAYSSLPTGVTAVAVIAKVSGTSGLAIALADEEGEMNYDTAVSTAAAHTPTFTGGTWRLPTQDEWKQMFASFGGDNASYSGLNTAITAAGGTGFVMYSSYCSSTVSGSNVYYAIFFSSGVDWQNDSKTKSSLLFKVRPCLAF